MVIVRQEVSSVIQTVYRLHAGTVGQSIAAKYVRARYDSCINLDTNNCPMQQSVY